MLALAAAVSVASASATVLGQTKLQAERNILGSVGLLRRLGSPSVNKTTNTLRSNTRVVCTGKGAAADRRYKAFACTLSWRTFHLRLDYVAQARDTFGVRVVPASSSST
ncbi:MAG TPA: hypothetical protein VG265_07470 [Gaiellaceae bacterium]|nr:hypothetical protein [Gaiellaceae bacterium]